MEHIIVGFDGSPAAESAARWVADRAARSPSRVGVVEVIRSNTRGRNSALSDLATAESILLDRAPRAVIELHRVQGGPSRTLATFAQNADLLVVGISPGHPMRATLAGALPLRLGNDAHVPVVLVPTGWGDGGEPVCVGIADDDSSTAALAFGLREAASSNVRLRLVHAWLMPAATSAGAAALVSSPESVANTHRNRLNEAVDWVAQRTSTIAVRSDLVRENSAEALLRFAKDSSLLVLGTHHRSVLAGSLLGAVGHGVLWRAECPIAIVPKEAGTERYVRGLS